MDEVKPGRISPEPISARELRITGLVVLGVMVPAVAVFFGIDVALGRSLFFTQEVGSSDLWHLNIPLKKFFADQLAAGRLPLWSSDLGGGFPLHAEGQVGALYLPNLVLFGLLPFALAMAWGTLLHLILAGVFAAMFARQLRVPRGGCVLAAVVFAFSGFMVTHVKHVNMMAVAVWAPLVLLLIERYAAHRRTRVAVCLALVVAGMVFAGHPQIAYNNLLIAGIYTVAILIRDFRRLGARGAAGVAGGLLAAVVLGVVLTAPQTLPTRELSAEGPRKEGLTREQAMSWVYHPKYFLTFLLPHAFGDPGRLEKRPHLDADGQPVLDAKTGQQRLRWEGFFYRRGALNLFWEITGYVGLLTLPLAAIGLGFGFRRRRGWWLLLFLGISVAFVLGPFGGIVPLLWELDFPGFRLFRFHSRFLLYVGLFLAVASGLGLGLVAGWISRIASRPGLAVAAAAAAVAIVFADIHFVLGDHNPRVSAAEWFQAPPSARRILADQGAKRPRARILDLDNRRIWENAYYQARGWKGDLGGFEVPKQMLNSNLNVLWGLPSLEMNFPLYPDRWDVAKMLTVQRPGKGSDFPAPRLRPARIFNVAYLLSPLHDTSGRLPVLARYSGGTFQLHNIEPGPTFKISVYRTPDVMPRAWLVPRAVNARGEGIADDGFVAPELKEVGYRLVATDFDPRREVLIDRAAGDPDAPVDLPGERISAPVEFLEYDHQEVRMAVDTPRPCWLVLMDTYYPGWRATVDGAEAEIYPANILGRAIRIPTAGRHEVALRYEPASFRRGLAAAAAALLGLALWAGLAGWWRRRGAAAAALLLGVVLAGCAGSETRAAPAGTLLDDVAVVRSFRAARASSTDPTGGNVDFRPIPAGGTLTLASLEGPAVITHIWITVDGPAGYARDLVLRAYWDDAPHPSVEAPLGDFFCVGHGLNRPVVSLPVTASSFGRGRNCWFRMPFHRAARLTVTNEGPEPVAKFYWHVDYRRVERLPVGTGYFHARYRQERPCREEGGYVILDAEGRGNYIGCTLSVRNNAPGWWGEGDERIFVDGESAPSLDGTGSEDYFGDAWGMRVFAHPFQGCTVGEGDVPGGRCTAYRFHLPDPIPFERSIRVVIEHGHANDRADDFFSVAYWYQAAIHAPFSPLPPAAARRSPAPSARAVAVAAEVDRGFAHYHEREWLKAAACFRRAIATCDPPDSARHHYNLACVLGRAAREDDAHAEEALDALSTAIALGFIDAEHIARDPDLEALRETPRFQELLKSLRRRK